MVNPRDRAWNAEEQEVSTITGVQLAGYCQPSAHTQGSPKAPVRQSGIMEALQDQWDFPHRNRAMGRDQKGVEMWPKYITNTDITRFWRELENHGHDRNSSLCFWFMWRPFRTYRTDVNPFAITEEMWIPLPSQKRCESLCHHRRDVNPFVTTEEMWIPLSPQKRCESLCHHRRDVNPFAITEEMWIPLSPQKRCESLCHHRRDVNPFVTTEEMWIPLSPQKRCESLCHHRRDVNPFVTTEEMWIPLPSQKRCDSLCHHRRDVNPFVTT